MIKRLIFLLTFCCVFFHFSHAQIIRSIPSSKYTPEAIAPTVSGLDAANLILDLVKQYAELKCTQTLNQTLGVKIDSVRKVYAKKLPKNSTAEFLVLANQTNCRVLQIVIKNQVIRADPTRNVCSVNDIKVDTPSYIYDPNTTGFFVIKLQI